MWLLPSLAVYFETSWYLGVNPGCPRQVEWTALSFYSFNLLNRRRLNEIIWSLLT